MKKTKVRYIIIALVLLAVVGAVFLSLPKKDFNVVLISMDTTRADRLGCYGYDKNTTPNIDQFAQDSVLFKSVVAPVPFTFPSHLSIMTGTMPIYHGVHDNSGVKISDAHITLAELLKDKGYKTGAIVASYVLDAKFGLNQGFDSYNSFTDKSKGTKHFCNGRRASETARLANQWIEGSRDEKFFLFTHFYDAHFPYEPPEPFDKEFKSPYNGEIASVDHAIGRIIDKLKETGLYDNTMIIILADHGELLGEHGEDGHGYYIYEGAIKVPLIVKMPGSKKHRKVDETVGLIDIFPTVCSQLGIPLPDSVQGVDLTAYLKGGRIDEDRYLYTESLTATKFGANSLLGVVDDKYKYIQTTRSELYDLTKDAAEENNLIANDPKRARLMQANLKLILDNTEIMEKNEAVLDLNTIKQLESLGYIGGAVDASVSFDQSRPDPKDKKYLHGWIRKASDSIVLEDWESAKKWNDRVLAEFPDLKIAQMQAAQIWLGTVKAEPDKARAYVEVGDVYFKLKKYERSLDCWGQALKLGVNTAEFHKKVAAANLELKNTEDAIKHLKISLELKHQQADVHLTLGQIYKKLGQNSKAMQYWVNSVEINPAQPLLHDKLAVAYYRKGKIDKVIRHWSKAAELSPDNAEVLNNLAWLLSATRTPEIHDPERALEYALRACVLTEYKRADYIDTLALAQAANGRYQQAIATALKALDIAVSDGNENLVDEIRKRLELYKSGKPYYD